LLDEARRMLQPSSASVFNDAIEVARQVPEGDPYYEQAQANIDRWGWVILDMAVGRAIVGNIDGAIAAAQLVPPDRPAVYDQAQRYVLRWQQQLANRQLIQQADALIEPGQASTFQDALNLLRSITPDQPEYRVAQGRINQWSEDILVIARARAAQGRVADAIAAAQLVPTGTNSYEQAQTEIVRWQGLL
ncbi:MAG: peptidase C14, partial [Cyanobacteria bacterium]|nr:peptidase C14 [Cyanobacteriota bacterium]